MSSKKFRFDGWVLDPESGDLERSGTRIRLQEQPALVLRELITHAGSVVTREQLIALLWPKGVVDFDTGVNTAIRKLRSALGDTAETPRYIETLPRRGYRFIGPVDPDPETVSAMRSADSPISAAGEGSSGAVDSAPAPGTQDESPSSAGSGAAPRRPSLPNLALVAAFAVAVLAIGAYAAWRAHFAASMTAVRVEAPPPSSLPAHTVAVLPFENLSAEPSDAFLATGIAESVLHRLASVKSLAVIARTSSFTFRGRDVDARDIGRKLNARYLVEGSVQRAGDRLRVTAQLLDASSGSDVWSLRLERTMGDIFELQDEISGKVSDAIGVSLEASPGNSSARATPRLDAYLAYIEGRSLLSTFKSADAKAGIERLRRATEIDPTFAAAYVEEAHGLRLLWWLLHQDEGVGAETEKQAAALVDKALSLDPELGEVEFARGNFAEAAKLIERAIAVDPSAHWMRVDAAAVYLDLGDTAAVQDVLSAIPPTATIHQSVSWKYCLSIYQGETQGAAAELYALPHGKLNEILIKDLDCASAVIRDDALERHDYGRGLRTLEVCLTPDWDSMLSRLDTDARASCAVRYASLLVASGERDRAAKLLHSMLKGLKDYKPYSDVAVVHASALALLGDTDGALKALEVAFTAQKFGWWYELERARAPEFEALHAQPRFQSLARQYQEIVAKQSALLAEMRRSGEVPHRPPQSATTSGN